MARQLPLPRRLGRRRTALVLASAPALLGVGVAGSAWVVRGTGPPEPPPVIRRVETFRSGAAYESLTLATDRGDTEVRSFTAPGADRAVVWAGGATRRWGDMANGLFSRLCADLVSDGVSSLWLRYRDPSRLSEAAFDVRVAATYLKNTGARVAALVGYSFGGAVAIRAAAQNEDVRTVVTLATQAEGTSPVAGLGPRCSILLVHGREDRVLPPLNSVEVYARARDPKRLVLITGASHALNEGADEVHTLVRTWLRERLAAATG